MILTGIDEAHVPAKAVLHGVPEEELNEARLRERTLLSVAANGISRGTIDLAG
ncbi:hypothetical protein IU486_28115 [Streptomyces gardneri]|uniref:hypothetical protein n=1 Tax=Nocardia sputi TaxID=2943705 RepID=UPI0018933BD7|nr:hypothetical protein [Nocardia sputi]MBF6168587.1 hypothetical protein [Streptomyces gardneri]